MINSVELKAYQRLAKKILWRAQQDFLYDKKYRKEIKRFIKSDWCELLCDFTGLAVEQFKRSLRNDKR